VAAIFMPNFAKNCRLQHLIDEYAEQYDRSSNMEKTTMLGIVVRIIQEPEGHMKQQQQQRHHQQQTLPTTRALSRPAGTRWWW
jgi:hypothetical protein